MSEKIINRFPYSRGSEWRKWDLHIHTPASICHDYGGSNEETWEKFICDLEKLPKEFSVIGINDYLFLDGYEKVLEYKKKGRLKNIDLILPILEFRLKEFAGVDFGAYKRPNIHVIFADETVLATDIIKSQFLATLDSKYILEKYGTEFQRTLTKESLIELGNKIINTVPDEKKFQCKSPEEEGFYNLNLTLDQIQSPLKKDCFKGKYLLAIGKTEWSQISWKYASPANKKTLINSCDVVFTSSESVKAFESAKQKLKNEEVKDLLLDCSDAHTFSYSVNKDGIPIKDRIGKCFTWIKADPTFEGLKQILYEADDRVKIQESKPEERESYQIIDSVKFLDQNFTQEEIFLNQNLTVIIGGKSTGKSVLLRNMAEAIDAKEVETRIDEAQLQKYPKELEVANFLVKWRDGQESKKVNSEISKKIIYIPQSYLNRLIDKKETKTPIFKIVEEALRQDDLVKESFDKMDVQQREIERNISADVDSLFFIEKDIQSLSAAIKSIGDKQGIEIEIKKLEAEITTLKDSSGISAEELKKYDDLKNQYAKLNYQKISNKIDLENLIRIKGKEIFIAPNLLSLSEEVQKSLVTEYESITEKYLHQWKEKIDVTINVIKANDLKLDELITLLTEEGKPLSEKVKQSKSLSEKIDLQKKEQEKLKLILKEEEKLKTEKEKFNTKILQIAEGNSKFYDSFQSAKNEILKQKNFSGEGFDFDISVEFKSDLFQKNFVEDVCNRSKIDAFDPKLNNYKFNDNTGLKGVIKKAVDGILKGALALKVNYTKQEAIKKLVQNWFLFHYQIKDGYDDISTMSPGKKSFIILKLLIELSNDRCPILLDQPEDDLDNRSIYNDLVKFIKDKKKSRQIIIVTHNPNLVVGADAECVIVANQSGVKPENKEYKFEYVTGSLENGFVDKKEDKILYKQGIREHVCDILEGGEIAFEKRKNKYNISKICSEN